MWLFIKVDRLCLRKGRRIVAVDQSADSAVLDLPLWWSLALVGTPRYGSLCKGTVTNQTPPCCVVETGILLKNSSVHFK